MTSRRDFIRQAAIAAGATGLWSTFPAPLLQAMGINPENGSTFYDAEHVVILMQENRSFDHCFGTLQGVRGFNDPRAIKQPNGNSVWLQSDRKGHTYAPFRLNIKDTKSTWMGSLPHSWTNMVDALNKGKMNDWLEVKKSGHEKYADMPLTMGFNTREDIPFHYAMADAFTVCDQHFCSSLTATTPNRLYLWSGTVRHPEQPGAIANVRNSDVDYDKLAHWRTFPELLEKHDIAWKIYQNELSLDVGFKGEQDPWLANFTDNPIEWFAQYHVKFRAPYLQELERKAAQLKKEVVTLEPGKEKETKQQQLETLQASLREWSPENFEKLPEFQKNLHRKAFVTNEGDPDYHRLTKSTYDDHGTTRTMEVPAGDSLYQFRQDVEKGDLPIVSWLIPSERFSDHPGSPWYGAWYISEVMNILTKNPEVWKKTIFIITYDESDGYFDHIPPFAPPVPNRNDTGKVSANIDTNAEYVSLKEELNTKGLEKDLARENSIGLGFRVPLIVASPWSRGGRVNSEVLDHTSILQFLEKFLSEKTGKDIRETNISSWRRTICGDLSSIFSTYHGEEVHYPEPVNKSAFLQGIYNAKFKELPSGYKTLNADEIAQVNEGSAASGIKPVQEKGIRDSCALPYEMKVSGSRSEDRKFFTLALKAGNTFGKVSAGVPYRVYASNSYKENSGDPDAAAYEKRRSWNYAVTAGDVLTESFPINNFEGKNYGFEVYGPNGFFRNFEGGENDPALIIKEEYEKKKGLARTMADKLILHISNHEPGQDLNIRIRDKGYGMPDINRKIIAGHTTEITINTLPTYGWYDFVISVEDYKEFQQRFAGRVETGSIRKTDPVMGKG